MPKSRRRMGHMAGLPPGSLVYTGEKGNLPSEITITRYNDQDFTENKFTQLAECPLATDPAVITWLNVSGIHQVKNLEQLGECYKIHPLVLEDILDAEQRVKIEDYDDYLYIALKTISYDPDTNEIRAEEVSLILGANYVITCHESGVDLFSPLRDRLLQAKGRIRKMGADYLAYAIIDLIVDNYFVELDIFSDKVESLEDEVVVRPSPQTLRDVHQFKNDMIMLRKSLWPLREVIARLERRESPLISENLTNYFRDVYDHTIIAIDTVETYRDILSGMLDIYLSSMSNRLNEIMKVLTVIATIFMPLTFITSLYGMNFKNMPELEWPYGYYCVIAVILIIATSMLTYFKKKHWL